MGLLSESHFELTYRGFTLDGTELQDTAADMQSVSCYQVGVRSDMRKEDC
jgi:hypothetical protein